MTGCEVTHEVVVRLMDGSGQQDLLCPYVFYARAGLAWG